MVKANVLGQSVTLADTGPLPESGGAQDATLLTASVPGLVSANVLHATTVAGGDQSRSEASVADPDLTLGGNHVTADFLMSRAEARCSNGKASVSGSSDIAVAGGIKNGGFWGHLIYIDHGSRMKVKGLAVTAYLATGPTSRHIEGTAEANGQPVTYEVDVADNGEPGRKDTFSLKLSNGYSASGLLKGGNIQLHLACK